MHEYMCTAAMYCGWIESLRAFSSGFGTLSFCLRGVCPGICVNYVSKSVYTKAYGILFTQLFFLRVHIQKIICFEL